MATYTVQRGDSYASIAGKLYGNQRFFQDLMREWGGAYLKPGMTFDIPDLNRNVNPFVSNEKAAEFGMATTGQTRDYFAQPGQDQFAKMDNSQYGTGALGQANRDWAYGRYIGAAPALENGNLPAGWGANEAGLSGLFGGTGTTGGTGATGGTNPLITAGGNKEVVPIAKPDIASVMKGLTTAQIIAGRNAYADKFKQAITPSQWSTKENTNQTKISYTPPSNLTPSDWSRQENTNPRTELPRGYTTDIFTGKKTYTTPQAFTAAPPTVGQLNTKLGDILAQQKRTDDILKTVSINSQSDVDRKKYFQALNVKKQLDAQADNIRYELNVLQPVTKPPITVTRTMELYKTLLDYSSGAEASGKGINDLLSNITERDVSALARVYGVSEDSLYMQLGKIKNSLISSGTKGKGMSELPKYTGLPSIGGKGVSGSGTTVHAPANWWGGVWGPQATYKYYNNDEPSYTGRGPVGGVILQPMPTGVTGDVFGGNINFRQSKG